MYGKRLAQCLARALTPVKGSSLRSLWWKFLPPPWLREVMCIHLGDAGHRPEAGPLLAAEIQARSGNGMVQVPLPARARRTKQVTPGVLLNVVHFSIAPGSAL